MKREGKMSSDKTEDTVEGEGFAVAKATWMSK